MNMDKQTYMIDQLRQLTAIPSPTGMTREASNYLLAELTRLGFKPERTAKGTALCPWRQRPSAAHFRPCGHAGRNCPLGKGQRLPAVFDAGWLQR